MEQYMTLGPPGPGRRDPPWEGSTSCKASSVPELTGGEVVAADGACTRLRDDEIVTVDGDTGRVYIETAREDPNNHFAAFGSSKYTTSFAIFLTGSFRSNLARGSIIRETGTSVSRTGSPGS